MIGISQYIDFQSGLVVDNTPNFIFSDLDITVKEAFTSKDYNESFGGRFKVDPNSNRPLPVGTVTLAKVLLFMPFNDVSIRIINANGTSQLFTFLANTQSVIHAEFTGLQIVTGSAATAEVTDITTAPATVTGVAAINEVTELTTTVIPTNLQWMLFYASPTTSVEFYFNLDVSAPVAAPGRSGLATRTTEILLATGDTNDQVSAKIQAIIDLDAQFTATVLTNVVTVTNVFAGAIPNATVGGPNGVVITQGADAIPASSLNGKYLVLADSPTTSVAFFFDVNASGVAAPAIGTRQVRVNLATGDVDTVVATKLATTIDGETQFSAVAVGNIITVTHVTAEDVPDAQAGTSGFIVVVTNQGTNVVTAATVEGRYFLCGD